MRSFCLVGTMALSLAACGGSNAPDDSTSGMAPGIAPAPEAETSAATPAPESPAAGPGTAHVSLTSEGLSITGDFPASLCGGPYIMGEGFAFRTQAEDWQITIASEERSAGSVPLNTSDGSVNVVVTANGPGRQFVRGPRNGGTLEISEDFRRAEADLELRSVVGGDTARLVVTFTCDAPA